MDESLAHGRRRRRRPSLCRHRPAVPRRAGRRPAAPARRARARSRSRGRRVSRSICRGTGRNDHHLAEAAFKALGPRAPSGLRDRSAPRRAWPRPRASSSERRRPADRGRRLRRGQPRQHRPGADARRRDGHGRARRGGAAWRRRAHRAGRRGRRTRRWPGSMRTAWSDPIRAWLADGRPFLGICLGLQLLFEGSDEDGATTLGVVPGRTVRLDRRADPAAHRLEPGRAHVAPHPLFDGIDDGADFYFVHSYAGDPGRDADDARPRHDRPRRAVRLGDRPRRPARRPVPPGTERRRRPAPAGQLRRPRPGRLMLRRRVIPCLDVADGRVVKGTRFVDLVDEGDPPELAERYAAEGADELVFLDITAAPERAATLLDIVERTARRAFIPLTVGGGVRTVAEMRDVLRAGADKVSFNTAAVADPTLISRCAARFGRQAVVVAIDARAVAPAPAATRPPGLGGRRQGRPRDRPGSTPSTGPDARSTSAPASCSSPRSTATGRARASTPTLLRAITSSRRRAGHRVGWRGRARRLRRARSATAAPMPSSPPRSSIAGSTRSRDVKAAMAAAGLPVRLAPQAVGMTPAVEPSRPVSFGPDGLVPAVDPGRRRRARADGRLHGRRGAGGDDRDRRGPLPLALTRPAVAQGRDERQRPAPGRPRDRLRRRRAARHGRSGRARPATAARAAASTPTARPPTERARASPGSRRCGRRSPNAPSDGRPARTRPRCSRAGSMPPAAR